ncbi:MAG: DUF3592 domain-containing protein [Rhodobacteraceae bacterium]|nr:DUF3592 domain-containing protein [Paracoccaceae bacterium]
MSKKMKLSPRSITIIVLLVGLLFITSGASITYFSHQFTRIAIATTGVITNVDVSRSSNGSGSTSYTYMPTISFVDEQGIAQSARTPTSSHKYNLPIGTEMDIRYNPYDPSRIKLDKWFDLWGFGALFLAIGFGIFAYVVFAAQQKKKYDDSPRKPNAPIENPEQVIAFLRKMGRDAEADEVLKKMQSADNDARPRD